LAQERRHGGGVKCGGEGWEGRSRIKGEEDKQGVKRSCNRDGSGG